MSPMNTNPLQTIVFSDDTQIATYCQVGLSIVTMIGNLINFFVIRKKFPTILVFQIQQIDSLVTSICQIGYIGILFSSISNTPNANICTAATSLVQISFFHFLLSNLFMVTGRYVWVGLDSFSAFSVDFFILFFQAYESQGSF